MLAVTTGLALRTAGLIVLITGLMLYVPCSAALFGAGARRGVAPLSESRSLSCGLVIECALLRGADMDTGAQTPRSTRSTTRPLRRRARAHPRCTWRGWCAATRTCQAGHMVQVPQGGPGGRRAGRPGAGRRGGHRGRAALGAARLAGPLPHVRPRPQAGRVAGGRRGVRGRAVLPDQPCRAVEPGDAVRLHPAVHPRGQKSFLCAATVCLRCTPCVHAN